MKYKDLIESQCTFWCSVLSDPATGTRSAARSLGLNAPFGAQCFPTQGASVPSTSGATGSQCTFWCSVLSDVKGQAPGTRTIDGLNAPFGAQCFPTWESVCRSPPNRSCLNAPFGAQCFPTPFLSGQQASPQRVSMHLLVLSAFRRRNRWLRRNSTCVSMHLLVLSAFRPAVPC